MTTRPRRALAIALGSASLLLLSACGGSDGSGAETDGTLQYVPTTSYALKAPATTTTTLAPADGSTTPAGGTSPGEQSYTIKANDNLSKIANLFDVEMELICSYNGWSECVSPPHLLLPGDTILIPPNAAVPTAASTDTGSTDTGSTDTGSTETDTGSEQSAVEVASTEEGVGCSHTIVEGDNPGRVANQYDITVDELSNANLNNPAYSNFLIGSSLNIPANGSC
jgi:LysM repeat protein